MRTVIAISCVILAGCDDIPSKPVLQPSPDPEPIVQPAVLENTGQNTSPDALDVVSSQDRQNAMATADVDALRKLGTVVGSLGNPAEVGFWVKTGFVSEPKAGQITNLATGDSVNVDLFPRTGATDAAEVSLSALRAINAPLAGLSKFDLFVRP
jgi:hypothetical protein